MGSLLLRHRPGHRRPQPPQRRTLISHRTTPHADNAMSALDQAIIKAYAKDRSASPWAAEAVAAAQPVTSASGLPNGHAIERLYHDGTLYRVEGARPVRARSEVPAPHLPLLPPTSPRRHVRRSMLKLLAANQSVATTEPPAEPLPRIARKVIIRHVSHAAAPPPLGLL